MRRGRRTRRDRSTARRRQEHQPRRRDTYSTRFLNSPRQASARAGQFASSRTASIFVAPPRLYAAALTASTVRCGYGRSTSFQHIAAFDVAGLDHAKIPARAAAVHHELRHIETLPPAAELPARRARLRDLHHRCADLKGVAYRDLRLGLSFDREIFAEPSRAALVDPQLAAPERIVIHRIHADRFVWTAMNGEIGLAVPGKVHRRQR